MIVSYLSLVCFLFAALLHIGFFVIETFWFSDPKWYRRFGVTEATLPTVKVWAFNMGVYNLCLGVGTIFGLHYIFKKQVMLAGVLTGFCGFSMIAAGVALWISAPNLRRAALLQILPPTIGFFFLALHVLQRLAIIP